MKAVEFIKKHGCEYTVDLLKNYPSHTQQMMVECFLMKIHVPMKLKFN